MMVSDNLIRQMYGKKVNQIMDKIDEVKKQLEELEQQKLAAMKEELEGEYSQLFDSEGRSLTTFSL